MGYAMNLKKIIIHSALTLIVIILSLSYVFYGKAAVYREDVESDFVNSLERSDLFFWQ